jgi:hypothetical protein
MSTTDALDRIGDRMTGGRVEAVVAVEQARAVAQVAAQVQVAQQFPRDITRVRRELDAACESFDLARVAFWALPNRGQGLSVHLARELAVIWGNVDHGVHELRRDEQRGMSEVQAFCWDMERNSRNTRTFQVPHMIMKGGRRVPIDDLQDVYRNNQNVGARAYRECVFATIPRQWVDRAERLLRDTLKRGDGVPLPERRRNAVGWFERQQVTLAQLEARVGRPMERWDDEDVAQLQVVADSIRRGETTVAEQFDPATARVTVDELGGEGPAEPAEPSHPAEPVGDQRPATRAQLQKIILMLRDLDVDGDEDQRAWLTTELRRPVDSRTSLTRAEATTVIDVLQALIDERGTQPGGTDT